MGKGFEVVMVETGEGLGGQPVFDHAVGYAASLARLMGHRVVTLDFTSLQGCAVGLQGPEGVEPLMEVRRAAAQPQVRRSAAPAKKPHGIPDRGRPPADGWYRHSVSFSTSKEKRTRHDTPAAPFLEQSYALVWRDFAGDLLLVSDLGAMVPAMRKAKATNAREWMLARWLEKSAPPDGAATVSYAALKREGKPNDYAALVETTHIKAL